MFSLWVCTSNWNGLRCGRFLLGWNLTLQYHECTLSGFKGLMMQFFALLCYDIGAWYAHFWCIDFLQVVLIGFNPVITRARFQKRSDHCEKVIGSLISRQLTISRSDRIPQTILLRSDHEPARSCSLRGSVLDQKFQHNNWSFYQSYCHS